MPMTYRVFLLDRFGTTVEYQDFRLDVPFGGSQDEDTDDRAMGFEVHDYIAGFVRSMTAAGSEWGIRTENVMEHCRRCDSNLENGYCTDETCPYSDHEQDVDYETLTAGDG